VFHELAHQIVAVKGDTTFNESFAVAVEEEGLRRWLEKNATAAEREAYAASRARRAEFVRLVLRYRERAAELYREPLPDEAKRAGKAKLFAELDADYGGLKAKQWGGFAGYDRFFAGMNNAHLASVAAYEELVPAFRALLAREGSDLPKFYAAVKELARLEKPGATARSMRRYSLGPACDLAQRQYPREDDHLKRGDAEQRGGVAVGRVAAVDRGKPRSTAPMPHWKANDVENIAKLSPVIRGPTSPPK
jgi:hypothetical protein